MMDDLKERQSTGEWMWVATADQVVENARVLEKCFHAGGEERDFYRGLLRNVKKIVVVVDGDQYLFCPQKFARFFNNSMELYKDNKRENNNGRSKTTLTELLGRRLEEGDRGYDAVHAKYEALCGERGIVPSEDNDIKRSYWVYKVGTALANQENLKKFSKIIAEVNRRADEFDVGSLHYFRQRLKGGRLTLKKGIFSKKSTKRDYAFSSGGQGEIQFNIGLDKDHGKEILRFGLAFSLERNINLRDVGPLIERVNHFNDVIGDYAPDLQDMSMWWWKGGQSSFYDVGPILPRVAEDGTFIFLGKYVDPKNADAGEILQCLDRLWPIYCEIERRIALGERSRVSARQSEEKRKRRKTKGVYQRSGGTIEVSYFHDMMQDALCEKLKGEHPNASVEDEAILEWGRSADILVTFPDNSCWIYEIKTDTSARLCIRQALGQLLEYAHFPSKMTVEKLIVVGREVPKRDIEAYIEYLSDRYSLPLEYRQQKIPTEH